MAVVGGWQLVAVGGWRSLGPPTKWCRGSGWLLIFPDGLWVVACYFLVASGWLLLFSGGLWMVAVISWWPLDGCCYFLVASGWLLIFLDGLWVFACYFLVASGWLLLFLVGSGRLLIVRDGL